MYFQQGCFLFSCYLARDLVGKTLDNKDDTAILYGRAELTLLQTLLVLISVDLWIEAKVEESNIRLVEVGQPVRIELDAYPFEEFTGTVRAIGRVTLGQQSGLGAPDSGNGVQRIRVDIELPDIGKPVWPGMRAAVNIVVRQGL